MGPSEIVLENLPVGLPCLRATDRSGLAETDAMSPPAAREFPPGWPPVRVRLEADQKHRAVQHSKAPADVQLPSNLGGSRFTGDGHELRPSGDPSLEHRDGTNRA